MYIKSDNNDSVWSSGGARWAFFAIFIVLLAVLAIGTIRVNRKRSQNGTQPIYGTRWLTPPLYRQSETIHNPGGSDPATGTYVPTYTATANELDMGYYDNSGEYHANPNVKLSNLANPISSVPPAHHRQVSDGELGPATEITDDLSDEMFRRPTGTLPRAPTGLPNITGTIYSPPAGPPPGSAAVQDSPTLPTTDSSLPTGEYSPPSGPPAGYSPPSAPPANYPTEGSSLDNTESLPSFSEGKNPPVVREK